VLSFTVCALSGDSAGPAGKEDGKAGICRI
jgi:hypothetical protein